MNASQWSARYAEHKRAAQRARDAAPRKPEPCAKCGVPVPTRNMDSLCTCCRERYVALGMADGIDVADEWLRGVR